MHFESVLAELRAALPAIVPQVVRPKTPATPPAHNVVAEALRHSLGPYPELAAFVREAVARDEAILVLVNDLDRATDTATALQAVREVLQATGLAPALHFLVATGTHGVPARRTAAEKAIFGPLYPWVAGRLTWHHAERSEMAELKVPDDEPVRLNRLVLEHTYLLPIGSMEPHYFAGVTGPHKTVTIGVLSRDSVERNHAGALHPGSRILATAGNPVYEGILRMVAALQASGKKIFAINELLDQAGHVLWCAAGDVAAVLAAGMPLVRERFVHTVDAPADLLVLHVSGPLAKNLYQADKGIKNNEWAVRDGGRMLLVAECPEGVGIDHFLQLLAAAPDLAQAQAVVAARGYRLGDHKAVKLRALTDPAGRGVRLGVVSKGLDADSARLAGMTAYPSVRQAVQALTADLDPRTLRVLVVEDAGNVTVQPA